MDLSDRAMIPQYPVLDDIFGIMRRITSDVGFFVISRCVISRDVETLHCNVSTMLDV